MSLVIYTKPHCPYCEKAIDHYTKNELPFTECDAQNDPEHQRTMLKLSDGDPTVPCFVEDGVFISSGWGDPPRGCVIIPEKF